MLQAGIDPASLHYQCSVLPLYYKSKKPTEVGFSVWSGKRDSNPRHSRWQRDALPTELFPHMFTYYSKPSAVKKSTLATSISVRTLISNSSSCNFCLAFLAFAAAVRNSLMSSAVNTLVSTVLA